MLNVQHRPRATLQLWLAHAQRLPFPAFLSAAADGPLALAASKASVGHAEAGAGLVGFALALLAVEARSLPRLLHLRWMSN